MQMQEGEVNRGKALDADLVVTESSGIESEKHNTSSRSENDIHVEDADIKLVNDKEPMDEVQITDEYHVLANEHQHTRKSKPTYYTNLLEKVDSNTTPDSTKISNRGGEIDHNAEKCHVDVNNVLSKPVTPYYLPKVREYVLAKPHRVIAPGSSRNSQKELYGLNDMLHNHYIEEARKKAQERNRNSKPSVMHTTSLQNTTNGSKQKPRSNNQTSKSLPVSKSSGVTSNSVPLVDHSRNPSSFLDSKHFVCSTCQKCIFNANHDACITKFRHEVNSHAKVQSHKTRISNKTIEPKSNTQKSGRQIFTVHRWIPTGKIFTNSTTKVDSEPPNGSREDITNPYKCEQTLNVSAGVEEQPQLAHFDDPCHELLHEVSISQGSSSHSWKVNGENQIVSKSSAVTATDASNKRQQQLDSTSSTSTLASSVSADGIFHFQNRRNLPRDIPLIRIKVLRYDTKGVKVRKGIMQTKIELTQEQTQQGVSDEVMTSWIQLCKAQSSLATQGMNGNPSSVNIKQHYDRSVLTDPKVHIKMEMEIPSSSKVKCEVIKLKNFKKDVSMSFQDKEEFEHVGPKTIEGRFNFRGTSLTGFPAQSVRSSNAIALDLPYLLVLITGASQSRQHSKSESVSYFLTH
ncbi:hypothetical protein Tco_1466618 [Tanacetum coccineum]